LAYFSATKAHTFTRTPSKNGEWFQANLAVSPKIVFCHAHVRIVSETILANNRKIL
jgi:hypothetical protein